MDTQTQQVFAYRIGLVHMSVCAPTNMRIGMVQYQANEDNPTGIDSPWRLDLAPVFSGGEPNPCPCEANPDRQHWLLSC